MNNHQDISKNYDSRFIEDKWRKIWNTNKYFASDPDEYKEPYCIIQPPCNANNSIHVGHAINNIFQDVLIRYKKLNGYNTLFLPGLDHGGISSCQLFNKQLIIDGLSKDNMSKDEYLKRIDIWIDSKRNIIINQLKQLGLSCDWSRERYTLSETSSVWVNRVFKELYDKQLIYRGAYIVNQCTSCHTVLSNDEVEHIDNIGSMYYIKYYFVNDSTKYIIVATTRPETMFGDVAVACEPTDERYKDLIGTELFIPIIRRKIRIIADNYVKSEFGTGLVKITPAHDKNDYDVAKRHNIGMISIIDKKGIIFGTNTEFDSMTTNMARPLVVDKLKQLDYLEKVVSYENKIGTCYRCKSHIETLVSDQWFLSMDQMKIDTLKMVNNGEIKFVPEHHLSILNHWLSNDADWCISRQIIFGHSIPIWYCQDCNHHNCDIKNVTNCSLCNSTNLKRDDDVLDTWFSSALWAFSVFDNDDDYNYYFPSNVLVTGSDILFFWVGRMIMITQSIKKMIPFKDVFLHGIVRDADGIKMSKTLGNGIDPISIVNEYSADILRFTLMYLTPKGQDTNIGKDDFKLGQTFCTKLWNCVRYVMMSIDSSYRIDLINDSDFSKTSVERWIINKLNVTIVDVGKAIDNYDFGEAVKKLYAFVWNDLCNCFLEYAKTSFDVDSTRKTTILVIRNVLQLLHPFIPFLTEELYQMTERFFVKTEYHSILESRWPSVIDINYTEMDDEVYVLNESIIQTLRNVKSEFKLGKHDIIDVIIRTNNNCKTDNTYIKKMCGINIISDTINNKSISVKHTTFELYVPIDSRFKIQDNIDFLKKRIDMNNTKLNKLKNEYIGEKKMTVKVVKLCAEIEGKNDEINKQIDYYTKLL